MGLPGLAISYEDSDGAVVDVIGLINAAYDLINLLRQLQRSKRQREDHAQQLLHDLQRSQVNIIYFFFILICIIRMPSSHSRNGFTH